MKHLQTNPIDYKLLADARAFYDRHGFTYLEVPWMVDKKYSNITTPKGKAFTVPVGQHLVGSGEQAFLQLALTKKIYPNIRFQTITPCFRKDVPDETHSEHFMKLELFEYFENPVDVKLGINLEREYFVKQSFELFKALKNIDSQLEIRYTDYTTGTCADIELNGIEIGSYGIRCYKNITWIYATGLALPRFSYANNITN